MTDEFRLEEVVAVDAEAAVPQADNAVDQIAVQVVPTAGQKRTALIPVGTTVKEFMQQQNQRRVIVGDVTYEIDGEVDAILDENDRVFVAEDIFGA